MKIYIILQNKPFNIMNLSTSNRASSEVQHAPLPNTPRGDEDASEVWSGGAAVEISGEIMWV